MGKKKKKSPAAKAAAEEEARVSAQFAQVQSYVSDVSPKLEKNQLCGICGTPLIREDSLRMRCGHWMHKLCAQLYIGTTTMAQTTATCMADVMRGKKIEPCGADVTIDMDPEDTTKCLKTTRKHIQRVRTQETCNTWLIIFIGTEVIAVLSLIIMLLLERFLPH